MFDSLVESGGNKGDVKRKGGFFAGTLAVYAVILTAIFVGTIFWYNADLDQDTYELLTDLDTPVQQAPEPEQAPEPKVQQVTTEQQVDVRPVLQAAADVPIPPKEISTAKNTVESIRTGVPTIQGARASNATMSAGPVAPPGGGTGVAVGSGTAPAAAAPPPPPPPPKPEPPKKAITISKGVLNGTATSRYEPPYPANAKAVRAQGAVSVQVLIDETGKVVSASAVSGHPLLRAAAQQAALRWRFTPTQLSGQPVKVNGTITFNFNLGG